jgi:DNA-binding Lrp family transcriptional regulator
LGSRVARGGSIGARIPRRVVLRRSKPRACRPRIEHAAPPDPLLCGTTFSAEHLFIMVTAIVLIQTEHGRTNDVAQALADFPEISEVYSVGGSYDVIALVRVKRNEDIANMVTERMVAVTGIARTETLIAFKTYSRHDLEAVFSIGLD